MQLETRANTAENAAGGQSNQLSMEADYGSQYYASHCGPIAYDRSEPHWGKFFGGVADEIVKTLQPRTVFDAGCAHGFLVEALWDRGVSAWGRDISSFAISQARADIQDFVSEGSIAEDLGGPYDLVTCIEVLEHMRQEDAIMAIKVMTDAAPRVLFSSSPSDFDEPTHINVKPTTWWLDRFAEAGFLPVPEIDASFLTQHAFVVERATGSAERRLSIAFAALLRERARCHEEKEGNILLRHQLDVANHEIGKATDEVARLVNLEQTRLDEIQRLGKSEQFLSGETQRLATMAQSLQGEVFRLEALLNDQTQQRDQANAELHSVRSELEAIRYSTTWRATRRLRSAAQSIPSPLRRNLRRALKLIYWIVTLQFSRAANAVYAVATGRMAALAKPSEQILTLSVEKAADLAALQPEQLPAPAVRQEGPSETEYAAWIQTHDTLSENDRDFIRGQIARLPNKMLISVVMPAYNTPPALLSAAIDSVRAQLYPNWELCVADDASTSDDVARILTAASAGDARIRWVRLPLNSHISEASNAALKLASGEFVALLDHDDVLHERALYEVALALNANSTIDILYSDEDRLDEAGRRHSPYFKPDWDPDLLLGQNCVSHLGVYRRSLLTAIGGMRKGFEGSQDYDLILRASVATRPERIHHIPHVLYHWRLRGDKSFSDTQLAECVNAARRAIAEHLPKLPGGMGAEVVEHPSLSGWHRVVWPLPDPAPRVSIIIPTRDGAELLARCVGGVLYRTDYPNFEVLIVDNGSTEAPALEVLRILSQDSRVRVLRDDGVFNYSAINNRAVAQSTGEILVLLNNDCDVTGLDWLRELVSHALRPDVGTVGARLLYPSGTVQHCGVVLGVGHFAGGPGVANHFGCSEPADSAGYFGHSMLARTVSASTAACLALRREVFMKCGGLNEADLAIAFNDVDLCLRIRALGLRNVWTPFAQLLHFESASRGSDQTPEKQVRFNREAQYMRDVWGTELDRDPYYNRNFVRDLPLYRLPAESQVLPSSLKEKEPLELAVEERSSSGPRYVDWFPSPENVSRVFEGEWSSSIPGLPNTGAAELFNDARILQFEEKLGGFAGKAVLELGPLEAGHTYMMTQRGASVVAIEANVRAWQRCLAVKEALGIQGASFLLGDFVQYLAQSPPHVDFLLASGVLYHMTDPVGVLERMCGASDAIGLWTHYFDRAALAAQIGSGKFDLHPHTAITSRGRSVELYNQKYLAALSWSGFCGGSAPGSSWLRREDIVGILEDEGFDCEIFMDHVDHPNGPAFCIYAQRRKAVTA